MSFQTVLQLEPQKIPGFYGFPLMTLGFAVAALIRCAPPARFRWIVSIPTLAALIGISIWQVRGAAAANIVAAPFFAVSLASLWPVREQGRQLVLAALIVSPASLAAIGLAARPLIEGILKPQYTIAAADAATSCQTVSGVTPLAALPRGRVMAPIDLGPAILAATDHAVFAAPYHRNNDGNLVMLNAMMLRPRGCAPDPFRPPGRLRRHLRRLSRSAGLHQVGSGWARGASRPRRESRLPGAARPRSHPQTSRMADEK